MVRLRESDRSETGRDDAFPPAACYVDCFKMRVSYMAEADGRGYPASVCGMLDPIRSVALISTGTKCTGQSKYRSTVFQFDFTMTIHPFLMWICTGIIRCKSITRSALNCEKRT